MWISKKDLYLKLQGLEKSLNNFGATVAYNYDMKPVKHDIAEIKTQLALFTKDVECLNQQVAELKKYLEG